ncbi:myelin-associated glycoprotein isoform X2 [Dicentrarchus labrax]|uniref:myelin-associated glycoprotein isoform X2 n=1 Tax=Dicentrarchus labrax TaxID=13489 RepID=UPI0021F54719|nr:myelin-associated glycoprotein isoform X2 [Dicentrarchus labrax]
MCLSHVASGPKKTGGIVFHNGQSRVLDHFKGRTKILGELSEGNCTLEIDDIKPFDNGPFCFHAEKGNDKYRFNNSCVFIVMKASPEKPVMTSVPAEVDAGSTITVSCSVMHTCPSHPPVLSWSVPSLTSEVIHTSMQQGIWQTTSTISFMVAGGDGVKNLTCTAISWRGKQQANTVKLTVKGSLMYQLRSSLPVSIPVSILLIAIILAAVFGVFIYRKRKRTDDSPPPRPEKRRSLWDRLSRRYPEGRERPPRPEKRGSIWSRFSRGARDDGVKWQNERRPRRQDDSVNLSVGYSHNSTAVKCDTQFSKQRFPSPKENRRPPRSARPEDSLYGNI